MPESEAPYKRTYSHTKTRGRERRVKCSFCGKKVPRYKAFTKFRGFRITDPTILKQVKRHRIHTFKKKIYVCPSCARFRGIVQPGKSDRKKHLKT